MVMLYDPETDLGMGRRNYIYSEFGLPERRPGN